MAAVRRDGENDLCFFTFPHFDSLEWIAHGVGTRLGGVSAGPWSSLNLGMKSGDEPAAVHQNRQRLLASAGLAGLPLATAGQVHGTRIGRVEMDTPLLTPETDGLITNTPGRSLLMLIADCPCIALIDPHKRAVGLGHAGWRGTLEGMSGRLVDAMAGAFGCRASNLLAAISPSIGPCCYEVGESVLQPLRQQRPQDWKELIREQASGAAHFDLWETNRRQLVEAGVKPENVKCAELCSACRTDLFYSHRKEAGRTGRFGMVAGILPGFSST